MTIVQFENPCFDEIAQVRAAARDLVPGLLFARERAMLALGRVRKAKTLDKLVRNYAEWLGVWYRCNVTLAFSMHTRAGIAGHHVAAYLQVKHGISGVQEAIDQRSHWIAMPNVENTRFNIVTVLNRSLASIDAALEGCAILEGHQATEGTAA